MDIYFICLLKRTLSAFQFSIILSFFSNKLLFKDKLYEGLVQKSSKGMMAINILLPNLCITE